MDVVNLGIGPGGDQSAYQDEVVWKKSYSLSDEQAERTRVAAARFLERSKAVLEKRAAFRESPDLTDVQRHALEQALMAEQLEAERSFQHILSADQIDALKNRLPLVLNVGHGDETTTSRSRVVGF